MGDGRVEGKSQAAVAENVLPLAIAAAPAAIEAGKMGVEAAKKAKEEAERRFILQDIRKIAGTAQRLSTAENPHGGCGCVALLGRNPPKAALEVRPGGRFVRERILDPDTGAPTLHARKHRKDIVRGLAPHAGRGKSGFFAPGSFRTVEADHHRVVVACPAFAWRGGRCGVALEGQALLHPISAEEMRKLSRRRERFGKNPRGVSKEEEPPVQPTLWDTDVSGATETQAARSMLVDAEIIGTQLGVSAAKIKKTILAAFPRLKKSLRSKASANPTPPQAGEPPSHQPLSSQPPAVGNLDSNPHIEKVIFSYTEAEEVRDAIALFLASYPKEAGQTLRDIGVKFQAAIVSRQQVDLSPVEARHIMALLSTLKRRRHTLTAGQQAVLNWFGPKFGTWQPLPVDALSNPAAQQSSQSAAVESLTLDNPSDKIRTCPKCGGALASTGIGTAPNGKKALSYECQSCHAHFVRK